MNAEPVPTATVQRAAFGAAVAVPLDGGAIGDGDRVVEWLETPGPHTLVTPRAFATALRDALTTRLAGVTQVGGPVDAGIGTACDGSRFATRLYAHADVEYRHGRLGQDPALLGALTEGLATLINRHHLRTLGRLAMPASGPGDAVTVSNKHVALRLIAHYDIYRNAHVVWVDVLGAA